MLYRQVVPADNSCLFTSINFCMSGEVGPVHLGHFSKILVGVGIKVKIIPIAQKLNESKGL